MSFWNASKAKVQLRLSVQRLRTLQQKKEAQAKASRRDIATLIEKGKIETAKIKVEGVIHEDIHVELLELLELYCELLLARFGLLDQNTRVPDPGVAEGICSIIHAAPRTELKELHVLRDILMHKYGREFSMAVMENRDGCVSDRVMRKLTTDAPSLDLVNAYLIEIAKAYGVTWSPPAYGDNEDKTESGVKDILSPLVSSTESLGHVSSNIPPIKASSSGNESAPISTESLAPEPKPPKAQEDDGFDALSKRFAALKKR